MLKDKATGTFEVGQPFDAVLLNQNLFEVEPDQLINTKVLVTYKAGRELFRTNP
jgi:predicted amidohydrolase YtcJ